MSAKFPNNEDMEMDMEMETPEEVEMVFGLAKKMLFFVGMLVMLTMAGLTMLVYLLLTHFGVIA